MKIGKILIAAIAAMFTLSACEEQEDLGTPKLNIDPMELSFPKEGGDLIVNLTATRDWMISGKTPEWIALSVNQGTASASVQTVTVTAVENRGHDREDVIVFSIGTMKASLTVKQEGAAGEVKKGTGTKEDPYTVAGVIDFLNTLGADVNSPEKVYVAGKVVSIKDEFSAQYGNGTFDITDDGNASEIKFTAYRVLYLGNKKWTASDEQIKVGDEVIIYGNVVNYKGNTPETQQNSAFLYALNGKNAGGDEGGGETTTAKPAGTGTASDPFNVAAAIAKAKEVGETATSEDFYIKGKVANVKEAFGAQYGNGTFEMVDEGYTAIFTAFRILYFGNVKWKEGDSAVNVNDEIVVCGKIVNFRGNTPETNQNSGYLVSLNGETGGNDNPGPGTEDTPSGNGTLASPYNPKAASDAATALGAGNTSENDFYIAGKISSVKYTFDAAHGTATFNISEDGTTSGTQFTIYGVYYLGNRAWVDGDANVAVGDEVIICGKLTNYNGTPETASKNAYIYSLNGTTDGGDPGTNPGPDNSQYENAPAITVAEFISKADANTIYKLTGTVSGSINDKYGNFDLEDSTGKIYIYGVTNWADFKAKVKQGSTVTLAGTYTLYTANDGSTKDEIVNAYMLSCEGGEDPGTNPGSGEVSANAATFVFANMGWENGTKYTTVTGGPVTLTAEGGSNTGKYYNSGNEWRFYQTENPKLTVSVAEKTLTSVYFEYTPNNDGVLLGPDGDAIATKTKVTVSGTSAQFTVGNSSDKTNGQVKFTKIVVEFE